MKIAFSTLGCPNWGVDEILDAARASGYHGVELRFYRGSLDLPKALGELPGGPTEFRRRFDEAGVAICCLDTSVVLSSPEINMEEAEQMMGLALALGSPFLRVFGGDPAEGESREACLARAARHLSQLGRRASERGLRVLLETHDAFSSGEQVAELLEAAGEEGTGALWDLQHPVRMGEPAAETARLIGRRTQHAHVKDGKESGGLTLLGEGEVPIPALVAELHKLKYEGYLSLEWEKAWHPEIPEPEVAFPHAARYLRGLLESLGIPAG
jgi:sugar phosphate isomerase/epimerase